MDEALTCPSCGSSFFPPRQTRPRLTPEKMDLTTRVIKYVERKGRDVPIREIYRSMQVPKWTVMDVLDRLVDRGMGVFVPGQLGLGPKRSTPARFRLP